MPQTDIQWLWFLFFAGGSVGGWTVLAILVVETWKSFRKVRG